jgi:hypothetical protein
MVKLAMWRYCISGLEVATDIALPGAQTIMSVARAPEVTMRRASVPESLGVGASRGLDWEMANGNFLWRVPSVARFLVRQGNEIAFAVEDGVDDDDVAVYLLGSAFGILLHQRGHLVLHASAIAVNGKAVLFCGPAGAGKSTLAAALVKSGYAFLNDDVCHIVVDSEGAPTVPSDGRLLKLWADAVRELKLEHRRCKPVSKRIDKFYISPPHESMPTMLPLGAIYGLRGAGTAQTIDIEKLGLAQAAMLLRRNAYRPPLVAEMGLEPSYFGDSVAVLRHAGAFHLTRPMEFSAMSQLIRRLEAHWEQIGL